MRIFAFFRRTAHPDGDSPPKRSLKYRMLKKIAHNTTVPALGGKDLRTLQDLITAEKGVLNSLQKLSADIAKASEALKVWGVGEGDDLGDVLTASSVLFAHFTAALSTFATHEASVRENMKTLRSREESLDELRHRRKASATKADSADKKLSKMNADNKNLHVQTEMVYRLREEIRIMDTDIMAEEASLSDFKRSSTKTWMGLKFGGLVECSKKGVIVGEIGMLVIEELPLDRTEPGLPRAYYQGRPRTGSLTAEAQAAISSVQFPTDPYQQTLTEHRAGEHPVKDQHPLPPPPPQRRQSAVMDSPMSPPSGVSGSPLPPLGIPLASDNRPQSTASSRFSQMPLSSTNTGLSGYPQVPHGNYPAESQGSLDLNMPQPEIYPNTNEFGAMAHGQYSARSSSVRSPEERLSAPRSARFATFPTKVSGPRSPSAQPIPLQEGDRPPSLDVETADDSFSNSVAEALEHQLHLDGSERRDSLKKTQLEASDDSTQSAYASPPPLYSPTALPPGAAPAQSQYGGTWNRPVMASLNAAESALPPSLPLPEESAEDELDVGLAYMSGQPNERDLSLTSEVSEDRRVKFEGGREEPKNVQSETRDERSAAQGAHEDTAKSQITTHIQRGETVQPIVESPNTDALPEADSSQPPVFDQSLSPRVPSPIMDDQALDAAAAREVSRELDALMFNGATPRAPSPLLPPKAPFTRRAVSPRPEMEAPQSLPASPRLAYVRERNRARTSSMSSADPASPISEPPSSAEREATALAPGIKVSNSPSPASSITRNTHRTSPDLPPVPGPTSSFYNLTTSSGSNPAIGTSARTISASAFRRPRAPTSPTINSGVPAATADITPLVVKKRPLPASPSSPLIPPSGQRIPSAPISSQRPRGPVEPRFRSASGPQFVGNERRGSQTSQFSVPRQSTEGHGTEEGEEEYDYISAYMQPQHPPPPEGRTSGFGHGRFAANMDRNEYDEALR